MEKTGCLIDDFDPMYYGVCNEASLEEDLGAYTMSKCKIRPKFAQMPDLPQFVILKSIPLKKIVGDDKRKFEMLMECRHQNLLQLYYWEISKLTLNDRRLLLHTEFCDTDLPTYMMDKQLSQVVLNSICRQMLSGFNYLHSCNIVHGDTKPTNILVVQGGNALGDVVIKLANAGLTSLMLGGEAASLDLVEADSRTWAYKPPEMVRQSFKLKQDKLQFPPSTDIFSLGVIIFEIMVKKLPFSLSEMKKFSLDGSNMIMESIKEQQSDVAKGLVGMLQWNANMRPNAKLLLKFFQDTSMKDEQEGFKIDILAKKGVTRAEYQEVEDQVMKFIEAIHGWVPQITKIEIVTNQKLEDGFNTARKNAFKDYCVYKFHGTDQAAINNIIHDGFRMPTKVGMYGAGLYFATNSSKSAQAVYTKGSNQLLLCKVLIGKAKTMEKSDREITYESLKIEGYDSVYAPRDTKNVGGVLFDEYVVYKPDYALPSYIIHYSTQK